MQASKYQHHSIQLDTNGKEPVFRVRYRVNGRDSRKVLGKAWLKKSRPPEGYLTEAQAQVEAQRFIDQRAVEVPVSRKTFRRACDEFLATCESARRRRPLSKSTMHAYRLLASGLCKRPWGEETWETRPIESFSDTDIATVQDEMETLDRAASTQNHYRRILRGVFGTHPGSVALAWEWIAETIDESEGKIRYYDPEQVEKLLSKAWSNLDRAIFILATEAGPRKSEILALRVENVDFEQRLIRFENGYTRTGGYGPTKGKKVRDVPMTTQVAEALAPYCQDKERQELVFQHPQMPGEPICGTSLYRRFVAASRRAGLPEIRFHDLRHSFGTMMIQNPKIDPYTLQRLMGHAKFSTTERYLHFRAKPDLAEAMDQVFQRAEVIDMRWASRKHAS